ncbi:hypothetical protein PR048_005739 [Dryococelus australis]|uniref:Uncharacterized protein n=1 Tax=Dryococelus australis TaxID=614101 RepID=A0ABQ9I933_9NEOP|nr:hypothetical protein PR048_005739 [Dryococelus australis]
MPQSLDICKDTFMRFVINNDLLDNIQKHHYLMPSVSGEAHKIIEGLPITVNNFGVLWGILYKAYLNLKLIETTHVRQLLSLPVVIRQSASDLRNLLSQLASNLRDIDALELKIPLHEALLSQLVLDRHDEQDRKEWEVLPLKVLCEFLEIRCQALELSKPSIHPLASSSVYKKQNTATKPVESVTQAYVAMDDSCMKCHEMHALHRYLSF